MSASIVYNWQITRLTLERALRYVPDRFAPALRWYQDMTGQHLARLPHRLGIKTEDGMPLSRDSGIYIPGEAQVAFADGRRYALSIHATGNKYSDRPVVHLADGTWIFDYAAHKGSAKEQGYNESLMHCLEDGVPVGVLLGEKAGGYTCLGLAFVERYNGFTGMFTLHGPVTPDTEAAGCFISHGLDDLSIEERRALEIANLSKDERTFETATRIRREQQDKFRRLLLAAYDNKCALTSTDVPEVLQAAHINPYRGRNSQVVANGILLRADLHLLFDSYLLSIDPDTLRVQLSERLAASRYAALGDAKLHVPSSPAAYPSLDLLGKHFEQFKIENKVP